MKIPILSRDVVREIDRCAIEEYEIPGMVLMENAGRGCTDVLCELGIDGSVVICCGKGNNAGDGLVIARHLDLRGHSVKVLFWSEPSELAGDAGQNYRIARHADLPMHTWPSPPEDIGLTRVLEDADWIVDALLGTGARGEPRPPFDAAIAQLNSHPAKKLAVDVPSGFDCETGQSAKHCFQADHTCTFAAAKPGLVAPHAKDWVGELHLLDIGIPSRLLKRFWNDA